MHVSQAQNLYDNKLKEKMKETFGTLIPSRQPYQTVFFPASLEHNRPVTPQTRCKQIPTNI